MNILIPTCITVILFIIRRHFKLVTAKGIGLKENYADKSIKLVKITERIEQRHVSASARINASML
jgi:hypothetical protein